MPEALSPEAGPSRSRRWPAFLAAVRFLTRLPIPGAPGDPHLDRAALQSAAVFFPAVGALIGLSSGCAIWAGSRFWPAWVATLIGLAAEAVLTGALHEDAVADFCDAFGGGSTREDVLRILKDSRVGSFGVLGLGLAVACRAAAIASLAGEPTRMVASVVASAALGRWAILVAMRLVPPVPDRESLSRDVGGQLDATSLIVGSLWALPGVLPWAAIEPGRLALAGVFLMALLAWFCPVVRRRIGGITGDCLGFLCYLGQLAILLAAVAEWPMPKGSAP